MYDLRGQLQRGRGMLAGDALRGIFCWFPPSHVQGFAGGVCVYQCVSTWGENAKLFTFICRNRLQLWSWTHTGAPFRGPLLRRGFGGMARKELEGPPGSRRSDTSADIAFRLVSARERPNRPLWPQVIGLHCKCFRNAFISTLVLWSCWKGQRKAKMETRPGLTSSLSPVQP